MSTKDAESTNKFNLLKYAVRGNALFCGVGGATFIILAGWLSDLSGLRPTLAFSLTGAILVGYAFVLLWLSNQAAIPNLAAWLVIAADVAWVLGSVLLLIAGQMPLTQTGKWLITGTADVVGLFAVVQYLGLRRHQR
jgi:hypothetical protein